MPTTHSADKPLNRALADAGLSGTDLARKIKTSEGQVSRWRNGLTPSEPYRKRIARALEMKVDDLWPSS